MNEGLSKPTRRKRVVFEGYTKKEPRSLCPGFERVSLKDLARLAAHPRMLEADFVDEFLQVPATMVREF